MTTRKQYAPTASLDSEIHRTRPRLLGQKPMATQDLSEGPRALPAAVGRGGGERRGSVLLVVLVALVLVAAAVALPFVGRPYAEPYILALLAVLGMVGVFALFAILARCRSASRSWRPCPFCRLCRFWLFCPPWLPCRA